MPVVVLVSGSLPAGDESAHYSSRHPVRADVVFGPTRFAHERTGTGIVQSGMLLYHASDQ